MSHGSSMFPSLFHPARAHGERGASHAALHYRQTGDVWKKNLNYAFCL